MKLLRNNALLLLIVLASACFDEKDITPAQQESFIKYYNNYPVFYAADVKVTNQGYALLGTVENSVGANQICLLRTNEYGNLIDSLYYGKSVNARANCLHVLSDGGFAVLGSSLNQGTGKREIYFFRTDDTGNLLWTRTISSSGNVEAKHFEINSEGSFIMTGYADLSNTDTRKQLWIGALDNAGNLLWSRKPYSDKDAEGRYLQVLSDNRLVITGFSKNDPNPEESAFSHAYILRANPTGIVSGTYYLPASSDEEGNCIRVIDDNNYLILGTVKTSSSAMDIKLSLVSVVDNVFTTQWDKPYGGTGNDYGQRILTEGNDIYILGTTTTVGTNTAISLIITDNAGNDPKYFNFGLGTQLSASSFEQTPDNGFIISGTNKLYENSVSATLIKTLGDGSL